LKVFLDSVGCRLNQAELEQFAAKFRQCGYEIADSADEADLAVINTCSVTKEAASDSRGKIRNAARSGHTQVIVTGCWSETEPETASKMSGVKWVIRNREKEQIASIVTGLPEPFTNPVSIRREILPGEHFRNRAFIKVQDGCDNYCTFCLTRLARGKSRSVPVETILQDIRAAENGGGKEIVLTGVNLGAWGMDLNPPQALQDLMNYLLSETSIPRIRLSSLESWNLDETFIRLWENKRLCPHLHLPLQSGSEAILKRMARRNSLPDLLKLIQYGRQINPLFSITTDIIVGFPGETDEDFHQTLDFVRMAAFSGGHVFTFSVRPGTAAAKFDGRIPKEVKRERSKILREQLDEQRKSFGMKMIGTTTNVLWESAEPIDSGNCQLKGFSENYLPVKCVGSQNLLNQISNVEVTDFDGISLAGKIISSAND